MRWTTTTRSQREQRSELYNRIREGTDRSDSAKHDPECKEDFGYGYEKSGKGRLRKIKMGFSRKRYDEEDSSNFI